MSKTENKKRKLAEKPAPKKVKEESESEESEEADSSEGEEVEAVQDKSPKKQKSEKKEENAEKPKKQKSEKKEENAEKPEKPEKDLSQVKTLLANTSYFFTEAELKKHFSKGGKVQKLVYDRCFVEYSTPEEAKKAAETLNDAKLRDFIIRVKQKEYISENEVLTVGVSNFPLPIEVSEIREAIEQTLGDHKSFLESVYFVSPHMVAAAFSTSENAKVALSLLEGKLKIKDQKTVISLLGPKFNGLNNGFQGKGGHHKFRGGSGRGRGGRNRGDSSPRGGKGKPRGKGNAKN